MSSLDRNEFLYIWISRPEIDVSLWNCVHTRGDYLATQRSNMNKVRDQVTNNTVISQ